MTCSKSFYFLKEESISEVYNRVVSISPSDFDKKKLSICSRCHLCILFYFLSVDSISGNKIGS